MSLVLVEYEKKGLAVIVLNRPDKMNALSKHLISELTEAASAVRQRAEDGEVRVCVLRSSSDRAFCAGADLAERAKMSVSEVKDTLKALRNLCGELAGVPVPTIAVIEGVAFGGGLELALACDMRIASPGAQLGLTETRLAIIPGAGGTQRLTRLVGESRAKEMIFRARRLSGLEAWDIGLVNVAESQPQKVALDWAEEILGNGPLALKAAKLAIEGGEGKELEEALDWEYEMYQRVLDTKDRVEGLKAFLEKRPPQYRGE
jgi:methylglutaconyl-CoA hydratase